MNDKDNINDLYDIKKWRNQLEKLIDQMDEYESNGEYDKSSEIWHVIDNHIKSQPSYVKLYRFHFLEIKLHLLNQNIANERYIDFTKHEIATLFYWLKEFMLGVLDTRVRVMYKGDKYDEFITNAINSSYAKPDRTKIGIPWESIKQSYKLLLTAKTINDMIIAVTMTLNAWHDNGAMFGYNSQHAKQIPNSTYYFAPLSIEQFDRLGNINAKEVEREIRKELS